MTETPHALGRLVEHDPRSRSFHAVVAPRPKTVTWAHQAPVLDQGNVGACTGFALAQWLNTDFGRKRPVPRVLDNEDALTLYRLATRLDGFPGVYPPTDTGSSGLAVCKAGVKLGWLHAYRWTFSWASFLGALAVSPLIVGTAWYEGMETPRRDGFLNVTGDILGEHEYLIVGGNVTEQSVMILNSWGDKWGVNGRAKIAWTDMRKLLADQGDVKVPVL